MTFLIATALGAYLIGSIPFGLILTKLAGHGDIRQIGSGNIGATNVLRTGNKALALATLLLDFAKAFSALFLFSDAAFYAAAWVVIGHMFPVWLGFKGGKGVACLFGIGFALSVIIGGWMAICWLTVFAVWRYSSLSAMVGIPAGVVIAMQHPQVGPHVYPLAIPIALMIAKHHENIRRLIKGEEHRFSFRSDKQ